MDLNSTYSAELVRVHSQSADQIFSHTLVKTEDPTNGSVYPPQTSSLKPVMQQHLNQEIEAAETLGKLEADNAFRGSGELGKSGSNKEFRASAPLGKNDVDRLFVKTRY
jgi:hypothetical protein